LEKIFPITTGAFSITLISLAQISFVLLRTFQ